MPCKRAAFSIRALLGNLKEVRLQGLLREKENACLGSISWTQRTLKVKVWGPSGTSANEQGSLELTSDYGAHRARFKAYVHRDRKGSNSDINII
jgi:hypothetical protein